jgi:hypothetical protein
MANFAMEQQQQQLGIIPAPENHMNMQFPDFLPAAQPLVNQAIEGSINLNVHINMALTGFVLNEDASRYFEQLRQPKGPKPQVDMYRLWAKHFSPVGCPEHAVQIPTDWAPFFTFMLLSPSHFDWAKGFLASQAWKFMLSCTNTSSMMTFAIPGKCPENVQLQCISSSDTPNSGSIQDENDTNQIDLLGKEVDDHSAPATKKVKYTTPPVEPEARRSPRIRSRNEGFKHNSCASRSCLACTALPPPISPKVMTTVGKDFCKMNPDEVSEESLSKKSKGKLPISTKEDNLKVYASKKTKAKDKRTTEERDDQGASKEGDTI